MLKKVNVFVFAQFSGKKFFCLQSRFNKLQKQKKRGIIVIRTGDFTDFFINLAFVDQ